MNEINSFSVQKWIPIEKIFNNGIIQTKDNRYLKIIKITPINYKLKSNLEKQAILSSYKILLKTCDFDLQILIQSNKVDLSKHISKIENNKNNNQYIEIISKKYIKYIKDLINNKKLSLKIFYIIINFSENKKEISQEIINDELNSKYYKIKECLFRCGNMAQEIINKNEIKKVLFSFLNSKRYFNI